MNSSIKILLVGFLVPLLLSNQPSGEQNLKIAVSKASGNYIIWLKKGNPDVEIIDMSEIPGKQVLANLAGCSGLLVTGGVDVHPGLYGKPEETSRCQEIDTHRDSLEQMLIRKALELKMPVLGICRGEQMINVTLGGTLIVDIPADYRNPAGVRDTSVHHQCADYLKCFHGVSLEHNTTLRNIIGTDNGVVTSNHHQAVRDLAPGLTCDARSPDGLAEGIEWITPAGKAFLIGVQWHPERMDTSNAFSGNLLKEFLLQSEQYLRINNLKKR